MERSHPGIYDRIGVGYRRRRVPDPRIAAQIEAAIGDARRICNVGAGAGSYEPLGRELIAVEPSRTMIAQRAAGLAVRAQAEALPFRDRSFDAALALMTIHHWLDYRKGLAELCRIAKRRVIFTFDPLRQIDFWLVRDYLPEIQTLEEKRSPTIEALAEALGGARVEVVPIPWDCSDGFQAAYWRRPERYLEPDVRASISTLAMLPEERVERAIEQLRGDLESGAFWERNAELRDRTEMDYAYRLVISEGG
jgi:SAM-dependent methyltransferase